MKYLKKYKIFENTTISDISDLSDILLELNDNGYKTIVTINNWDRNYTPTDKDNVHWIVLVISKNKEFNYSDIKEVIERLSYYLKTKGLISFAEYETVRNKSVQDPRTFSVIEKIWEFEIYYNPI